MPWCPLHHGRSLGLYKVKVISSDTQTWLFAISPDMPSRQQAEVMLQAAQQLRDVLSKVGCWPVTVCHFKVQLLLAFCADGSLLCMYG